MNENEYNITDYMMYDPKSETLEPVSTSKTEPNTNISLSKDKSWCYRFLEKPSYRIAFPMRPKSNIPELKPTTNLDEYIETFAEDTVTKPNYDAYGTRKGGFKYMRQTVDEIGQLTPIETDTHIYWRKPWGVGISDFAEYQQISGLEVIKSTMPKMYQFKTIKIMQKE